MFRFHCVEVLPCTFQLLRFLHPWNVAATAWFDLVNFVICLNAVVGSHLYTDVGMQLLVEVCGVAVLVCMKEFILNCHIDCMSNHVEASHVVTSISIFTLDTLLCFYYLLSICSRLLIAERQSVFTRVGFHFLYVVIVACII